MNNKKINIGSDFTGVGAFNEALRILDYSYNEVFACDLNKYSRKTFLANNPEPEYFPMNVYHREIPCGSLDLYVTTPPCQAFSIAGGRAGESDDRGVLFYNSLEFMRINQPRYAIFENVKGLVNHDKGRTFSKWLTLLGGLSVNGLPTVFKHPKSIDYHVYYAVLNALDFNTPQNRERVFIICIRDDKDNNFSFPKPLPLKTQLKDILEKINNDKYKISKQTISQLIKEVDYKKKVFAVKSATKQGHEVARFVKDSINVSFPKSVTRRGRVGENCTQTLTTSVHTAVSDIKGNLRYLTPRESFRAMGFSDNFKIPVSDNQAYFQAGNSVCPKVLVEIIKKLKFN